VTYFPLGPHNDGNLVEILTATPDGLLSANPQTEAYVYRGVHCFMGLCTPVAVKLRRGSELKKDVDLFKRGLDVLDW